MGLHTGPQSHQSHQSHQSAHYLPLLSHFKMDQLSHITRMKLSTLLSALVLCLVVAISCVVEAASGSFPVSFKPSKPPKWSREEQAHIAQLFPNGIRSEPQKGTLKWHSGDPKPDAIMNQCVPYGDEANCYRKYYWDGSCRWSPMMGVCTPAFSSCEGYEFVRQQHGATTTRGIMYPCMGYSVGYY